MLTVIARALGTSVPRVTRAAAQLGIDARQGNGRFAFSPRAADRVREALGSAPNVDGLSRSEVVVLAALRSAPFGLGSVRAVARRGALSPTATARALDSLGRKELVERSTETVAEGRARERAIWRANLLHPRWPSPDDGRFERCRSRRSAPDQAGRATAVVERPSGPGAAELRSLRLRALGFTRESAPRTAARAAPPARRR